MSEENQAQFSGWAKVEVMGHQSHVGFVETQAFGQAVLFRIDRPEIPEREETLTRTEWVGDQRCPEGTVVKRGKIEAATVLVGSGSIYRIIPCTEAVALRAIVESETRPLLLVRLPDLPLLAEPGARVHADDEDDQDRDDDVPF